MSLPPVSVYYDDHNMSTYCFETVQDDTSLVIVHYSYNL